MSRIFGKKEFAVYVAVMAFFGFLAMLVDFFFGFLRWMLLYLLILIEELLELARWMNYSVERLAFGLAICLIAAGWAFDTSSQRFEPHPYFWVVVGSILLALAFVQCWNIVMQKTTPVDTPIKQQ